MNFFTFIEITFVRFLTIFIQLLFIKYITNLISVDELGVYYFLLTVSYSLNAILLVPLDYFQQANLYKYIQDGISIKSYFYLNKKIAGIILLVLIIGGIGIGIVKVTYCLNFILIISLAVGTYMALFLRGIVNNLEHRRRAAYNLLLESVARIAILYVFVSVFTPTPFIILSAILIASVLAIILLFLFIYKLPQYKNGKIVNINMREVWHFSFPISIGAVVNWIQLQGYRLVLVPMGFSEVVGYYATVANIGSSGMNVCSTIYNQLFLPELYKTKGYFLKKYICYALGIIAFVFLVSLCFKDLIVRLLTNSMYAEYSYLLFFGIVVEAGNFITGGFITYLGIWNSTKFSLKVSLCTLFSFVLFFVLMLIAGKITPLTIGMPIVISQLLAMIYLGSVVHKIYLEKLDNQKNKVGLPGKNPRI